MQTNNDGKFHFFNVLTILLSICSIFVAILSFIVADSSRKDALFIHKNTLKEEKKPYIVYEGDYGVDLHRFYDEVKQPLIIDNIDEIVKNTKLLFDYETENRSIYREKNGYIYKEITDRVGYFSFYVPLRNIGSGIAKNIEIYELPSYKLNEKNFQGYITLHNSSLTLNESPYYSIIANSNENLNIEFMIEFCLNDKNQDSINLLLTYQDIYENLYSSILELKISKYDDDTISPFFSYVNADTNDFNRYDLTDFGIYNTFIKNYNFIISHI